MKQLVIFSDLDGTLLDAATYSFAEAKEVLHLLRTLDIPLVFCSSKTRAEMLLWRKRLDNRHPFISENGGGIFIPHGYFGTLGGHAIENAGDFHLIRLGAPHGELCAAAKILRERGVKIRTFSEMDVEEVAGVTGLPEPEARLARMREFDEPFIFQGADEGILEREIASLGYRHTKGAFHHLMGNSDKGKAVNILIDLYKRKGDDIVSIGLGDSPNDQHLLNAVDIPVLVRLPGGRFHPEITLASSRAIFTGGIGPKGWNEAIKMLLKAPLL